MGILHTASEIDHAVAGHGPNHEQGQTGIEGMADDVVLQRKPWGNERSFIL